MANKHSTLTPEGCTVSPDGIPPDTEEQVAGQSSDLSPNKHSTLTPEGCAIPNVGRPPDAEEPTAVQEAELTQNKNSTLTPETCFKPMVMDIQDVVLNVTDGEGRIYQEKTVVPSGVQQIVTPDANYAALSRVIVEAIPSDYGKITYSGDEITVT